MAFSNFFWKVVALHWPLPVDAFGLMAKQGFRIYMGFQCFFQQIQNISIIRP